MAVLRMAILLCPISVSGTQFDCWAFLLLPLIIIFQISKLNVMLVMPFVRKSYVTYIVQCNFFPLSTFIWKLSSGPLVVVLQYFVTKYHDFAKFLTRKRSCPRSITQSPTPFYTGMWRAITINLQISFFYSPTAFFTVKPIHFKAILEDCINK